jgi:Rrf2 family protein
MQLSQTIEYAVRAVLHIAARHPEPVRSADLAASLELPANYLSKTLGQLARAGILLSTRGAAGGFRLGREAQAIPLADIVRAFGPREERRCLLGLGTCGHVAQCPAHEAWLPSASMIDRFFDSTTVAALIAAPSSTRDT